MKAYNNMSDIEKDTIREYNSWKKTMCDPDYKLSMLEAYMAKAEYLGISDHLKGA